MIPVPNAAKALTVFFAEPGVMCLVFVVPGGVHREFVPMPQGVQVVRA